MRFITRSATTPMLIRTLTVLLIGCALVVVAFGVLDVPLTRRLVGGYVLLPIGALLVAFGLCRLAGLFVDSE